MREKSRAKITLPQKIETGTITLQIPFVLPFHFDSQSKEEVK